MLKKLAKWLRKALPNHQISITVTPKAVKKAAVAAEPETAEMKRWRLLADHNKELADKQKPRNKQAAKNYYQKNKERIKAYMREYTKNKRLEQAKAEGRELRGSTKRNIPVSAVVDRKAYNAAYYNQTKFTGTTSTTFQK